MTSEETQTVEKKDAEKVDAAMELLKTGSLPAAAKLLLDVISRTPKPYVREFEADGKRYIRFWDAEEFMHFVTDQKQEIKNTVVWLKAAYPRAFYYMGFCCVKANDPSTAIQFLDAGYKVEPHPIFLVEKGKALAMTKRHEDAMACHQAAFDHAGVVRAAIRAVALRGKGVQLIDLKRLDEAEQAFEMSLKLEPNNPIAMNELKYIAQLRRGGRMAPLETVAVGGLPMACAICGRKLESGSKIHNIDGRVVLRCAECAAMLPKTGAGTPGLPSAASATTLHIDPQPKRQKAWWQFWK